MKFFFKETHLTNITYLSVTDKPSIARL